MSNRIQDAFSEIKADETLKRNTLKYIQKQNRKKTAYIPKFIPAAALCVLMLLVGTAGFSLWQRPVSCISVDVNPSIELELNRFDRVISVNFYNKEGAGILEDRSVYGKIYTDALGIILGSPDMAVFLQDGKLLEFAVAAEAEKEAGLKAGIENMEVYASHRAHCETADMETARKAHDCEISLGKYILYLQLLEYDSTVTVDDCRHHSAAELHNRLSACSSSHHPEETAEYPEPGEPGQAAPGAEGSTSTPHGHGHGGHH